MIDIVAYLVILFFTLYGMGHFTVSVADYFVDHRWHW